MMHGLFITGTDTGVGKTLITAGTVRWLRCHGIDAIPMKPVQTGGVRRGNSLAAPDLEFCLAASDLKPGEDEIRLMSPYVYEPACSPHLAGRITGRFPQVSVIEERVDTLLQRHKFVVAEGAGGVMVPFNETATMLDLAKALAFPVVLVSRPGLGTINHSLLSIQALRASGLSIIGIVFNRVVPSVPEDAFIEKDNLRTIAELGEVTVLGTVRYLDRSDWKSAWRCFDEDVPGLQQIYNEVLG